MNLVEYIFRAVRDEARWSDTAIVCGDEEISYAQLLSAVRRFAGVLRQLEVGAGERVAIAAHDCPAWVATFLGTVAAGAVAVPVSTLATATELAYVLEHCGARVVVLTAEQWAKLAGVRDGLPQLRHVLLVDGTTAGALDY